MKKALTLGDLIAAAYDVCGKSRAIGILQLAAKARLILFQRPDAFVISTQSEVARTFPESLSSSATSHPRLANFSPTNQPAPGAF